MITYTIKCLKGIMSQILILLWVKKFVLKIISGNTCPDITMDITVGLLYMIMSYTYYDHMSYL